MKKLRRLLHKRRKVRVSEWKGSAFVALGKITETKSSLKESSFPAEVPPIKLMGVANLQSPVIARKFLS